MLKHFAIKTTFNENYDPEWYLIPKEVQNILQKVSNDVFNNDQVWPKIPNYIIEMVNFDEIKDEEDNYNIGFVGGNFYWCSNRMAYYLDINQWMLLDPKEKNQYEYVLSNTYYQCELIVHISNIYKNPTVQHINLDVDLDGDIESYEIYPECKLKYPLTKDEIINNFGEDAYKEEE